jgi:hypothetical protein
MKKESALLIIVTHNEVLHKFSTDDSEILVKKTEEIIF